MYTETSKREEGSSCIFFLTGGAIMRLILLNKLLNLYQILLIYFLVRQHEMATNSISLGNNKLRIFAYY